MSEERRPVHDALREWVNQIDINFQESLPSFRRDRTQTAAARERPVTDVLEAFFPPDWSVKKGLIYDSYGSISQEVDCALCGPQHPSCRTPVRDVILAEGVHAAVEVKPDISTLTDQSELGRALLQAKSVKTLKREFNLAAENAASWPQEIKKIPYVIFSKDIADLEKTAEFLDAQKIKNQWSPWDLPDLVVGYKEGILYHAADIEFCSLTPFFKARTKQTKGEYYVIFPTGADTLILFFSMLYAFPFVFPQMSQPLLKKYLLPISIPAGTKILTDMS